MASYGLVTPCANCPFRTDIKPFISSARAQEILATEGEFPCHKTIVLGDVDDEGDTEIAEDENAQFCAGFLICREHDDAPNQIMRIAERVGLYDRRKLRMDAPVYKGVAAAVKAHRKAERNRR